MHNVLVFDLDGTLAEIGKGIPEKELSILKALEDRGYQIVLCSGKTTFYLCGFMRQVGLNSPILIGENGANIQFGVDLPPERFYVYPYLADAKKQISRMKEIIEEQFASDIWIQPNIVGFTPFPKNPQTFENIEKVIEDNKENLTDVLVYRHVDSFDITPKEINKYNGLKYLTELMQIDAKQIIAIGDGVNDIPMFQFADMALGIGDKVKPYVDRCFENIHDALKFIKEEGL